MDVILSMPWPLRPEAEKAFLMRCRELAEQGEERVLIRCDETPHPSTRVLTLLLNIAHLAPYGPPQWRVIDAQENLLEALRLTGLDHWFKNGTDEEAVA
ncbi:MULTISPECIES: hypothetical protein [unclassified Hahella]|uniref:hypothetical protein n=1 Tax=unclassified Hahella TaxID=2624107 RepID=UPI000FDCE2DD|nr:MULTISPECIES: hypothetical protein [unclassified Hahella]AZZ91043.1 hypothetical protein ENC22_07480 [Hahella sp. KA22]MBU6949806.1 hypothetical protein [Hahella sp. HN01]MDG9668403.1 hypothetical protein [Hahella sp. CR1]QAY54413.1 hypothetical protein EUZ85_10035 [Hahella sp. KA22]